MTNKKWFYIPFLLYISRDGQEDIILRKEGYPVGEA
jgi:hypothetical protein